MTALLKSKGFWAAVAVSTLLIIYLLLVMEKSIILITQSNALGVGIGIAMLLLPVLALWYLISEWRLAVTVQKMATELVSEDRLPAFPGERTPSGKLNKESAQLAFEAAVAKTEADPENWRSWFQLGYAYDEAGERAQGRKMLNHAAGLFRNQQAKQN